MQKASQLKLPLPLLDTEEALDYLLKSEQQHPSTLSPLVLPPLLQVFKMISTTGK